VTSDTPNPVDIASPAAPAGPAEPQGPVAPVPAPAQLAGVPSPAARRYLGTYAGRELSLALSAAAGDQLRGSLQIGRKRAALVTAHVQSGRLVGSFRAGERDYPFQAELREGVLEFEADGRSYALGRAEEGPAAPPTLAASFAPDPEGERDPRLLGTWLQGPALHPPPGQLAFEFRSDGTYVYGRPGSTTDRLVGVWQTRKGALYTHPEGLEWARYADYRVEEGILILTHTQGEVRWYRP
jgi:hypothetical protein